MANTLPAEPSCWPWVLVLPRGSVLEELPGLRGVKTTLRNVEPHSKPVSGQIAVERSLDPSGLLVNRR